jgi:hypothetical protein
MNYYFLFTRDEMHKRGIEGRKEGKKGRKERRKEGWLDGRKEGTLSGASMTTS